jgi:hypothetical protein
MFKTLVGRPVPARRPDSYVIYKKQTLTVVGMWGDALYRNTVIRAMEQSFPGQYGSTEVWARLDADGTLVIQFGVIDLMLPECYRQEFERMLRSKVEAHCEI